MCSFHFIIEIVEKYFLFLNPFTSNSFFLFLNFRLPITNSKVQFMLIGDQSKNGQKIDWHIEVLIFKWKTKFKRIFLLQSQRWLGSHIFAVTELYLLLLEQKCGIWGGRMAERAKWEVECVYLFRNITKPKKRKEMEKSWNQIPYDS